MGRIRSIARALLESPSKHDPLAKLTASGRVSLGRGSYGEPSIVVYEGDESGTVRIGAYCSIASGVRIFLGGEHRPDWVTTSPLRIVNHLPGAFQDGHPSTKGD